MVCSEFQFLFSNMIHIALRTLSHPDLVQHACKVAAAQDGNACLLDVSTDGVSWDVNSNKKVNLEYLCERSNTLALVDNKHNNKNVHGQVVTATLPSSIGCYFLDPWHLKMAGMALELNSIED